VRYLFFLICIFCACNLVASDNHSHDTPSIFLLENLPDRIKKIIETHNFKSFELDKQNKLYTNASESINFVSIVNKIILAQDNLFTSKSKTYDIVLIDNQNLDNTQGVTTKDYVIVEGNFKKNPQDYNRVISHELAHRYIGQAIKQNTDKKIEIKYKWFFEGFTEFYGVKTLLDAKFIDISEYLTIANIILKEYFHSPINEINFERIDNKSLLDKSIMMLSYNKGFILALIINEKLCEVSNGEYNLLNIINEMINEANSKHVDFNIDLFLSYLRCYLPESFIEKVIISINNPNMLLNLLPNKFLSKDLIFQDIDQYSDICFDLTQSLETRKIHGVKLNSHCYNEGLRNGQKLKCFSMYFNSGDIKLKVLKDKMPEIVLLKANKTIIKVPIYH
jgi:predicted metalloprotease with PDZ domain